MKFTPNNILKIGSNPIVIMISNNPRKMVILIVKFDEFFKIDKPKINNTDI